VKNTRHSQQITIDHLEETKLIDFKGPVQYETIGELIHYFKSKVHPNNFQTGTYKKILLIMIESLENIMKYSQAPVEPNTDESRELPAFSISKNEKSFVISSSNPVNNKHLENLVTKINHLNTLNQQGLKEYYKETITNGQFSHKGGAGLGLIEIAKISGRKIHYCIDPLSEQFSRFTMTITIDG
jgi:hypothetical protein